MSAIKVNILSGKGAKAKSTPITLADNATLMDLKKEYAKICKRSVDRLSFKKDVEGEKPVRLENDTKTLKAYGIINGDEIAFKDLGPQIGYRTVFVVEYAGPLLIMLFYALRPSFIFGAGASEKPFNW